MDLNCIRHSELPHASKLFTDFLYHFERVAHFYDYCPSDAGSYRRAAEAVRYPKERRAELAAALREQNEGSPLADALAQPGTLAVLTGQQVGLFSGPAYSVYKALSAARLAGRLNEEGIPAVPVFWLATEDHDFAEVNHCWTFNSAGEPVRIEAPAEGFDRRPVGGIPVAAGPIEKLRGALRDFPFGEEVIALAEEAYRPGATFGEAFAAILRRVLARCGLLFFDPMHSSARKLAAPLLREALSAAPELARVVIERNQRLEAAGYHAQVHFEEQTSFFFLFENGRRVTLHRAGSDYTANGRRFRAEELAERAEQLSPNALLRPVVQDYLFPTVAYVGGPAELAYLAQAQVLYRALLGRMPVCIHRNSWTLLDGRAARLMRRYGLALRDFFHGEEPLRERISQKLVPPELSALIGRTRADAARLMDELGAGVGAFDASLAAAFEKSRRKIEYQLSKMERKVAREALLRSERASRDAAYLYSLVYPHKHLQERFYSILPFLARHGLDLVDRLYQSIRPDCPDHQVLVI